MLDDDEFDKIELPNFSAEDLEQLDSLFTNPTPSGTGNQAGTSGGPRILIGIAQDTDMIHKGPTSEEDLKDSPKMSPFEQFRSRRAQAGALSVTDLVAPAWCELKYDYGLRQKKHKPLESRPASFQTAKGKEIFVQKEVAKANDRVLKAGTTVHMKLERELHAEPVKVKVESPEERQALVMLDVMTRLRGLITNGHCRELKVWGALNNHLIFGCIDEIHRSTKKSKPAKSGIPSPRKQSPSSATHTLSLIDNKTRHTSHLPPYSDTESSRLQLMIYRRLLLGLVSKSEPYDLVTHWQAMKLDPIRQFSPSFIDEVKSQMEENSLVRSGPAEDIRSLEGLVQPFRDIINELGVAGGVNRTLCLVYRRRGSRRQETGQVKNAKRLRRTAKPIPDHGDSTNKIGNIEVIDLTQDDELEANPAEHPEAVPTAISGGGESEYPGLAWAIQQSLQEMEAEKQGEASSTKGKRPLETDFPLGDELSDASSTESEPKVKSVIFPETDSGGIVGTTKFRYDETAVEAYLTQVFEYWHGDRPPRGVELETSRRCNTCEYRDGCEWRESKAQEALELHAQKKAEQGRALGLCSTEILET